MKSQVLRASNFLVEFLKEINLDQFQLKALSTETERFPTKVQDFKTLNGSIDVHARKEAVEFCEKYENYIKNFAEINSL